MLKLKIVLLCLMLSGALYTGAQAIAKVNSLRKNSLPEEIYSVYESRSPAAEYYVKSADGYVTVYRDRKFEEALRVTEIESGSLREADKAMLEKGIPVRDRAELLQLLEDLGS